MMKKSAILLIAFLALVSPKAFAQGKYGADSATCVKYLSYYTEYMKQDDIAEATPFWQKAIQVCPPTASQTMLLDGQKIMRRLLGLTNDPARRKQLIDSLLMLHDMRIVTYPKYAATAENNKALDMLNYMNGTEDQEALYKGLGEAITANEDKVSPVILVSQMKTAVQLYQAGKLGAEDIMNTFTTNNDLMDKILVKKNDEQTQQMSKDLQIMFASSGVASCDNLIALYTPRYEATPNDEALINTMVKMMASSNCMDNDLFVKAVVSLYGMDPSASTAHLLYQLYDHRDDDANAIKYLQEAIDSDAGDPKVQATYYYEMATFCYKKAKNNARAVAAAKKAKDLDPSLTGKCFMLIGYAWGSTRCGGNEIESRAPYWVACDYMQRAKNADPSLTPECNDMIAQYSKFFPATADAFMYDVTNGQSYTVSCGGLSETTTVRTVK
jgi:tetratricopeptide (TPR) repeat protein